MLDLGADLADLAARARAILTTAEASGDAKTALAAIREARGVAEAFDRVAGRVAAQGVAPPLHLSAEWHRVAAAIEAALTPFPEARLAVADAVALVEASP